MKADATKLYDTNSNVVLEIVSTASAVNWEKAVNSATGQPVERQAAGADTNIDLKLTPKGTGRVVAAGGLQIGAAAGAVNSAGLLVKSLTALADATDGILGVITVPNLLLAATVRVTILGALGDGDSAQAAVFDIVVSRVAGANAKAVVSSATGTAQITGVSGNATVLVTVSAVSGAVGASNSFNIQARVTRSAGSATNHFITAELAVINPLAGGVTVA